MQRDVPPGFVITKESQETLPLIESGCWVSICRNWMIQPTPFGETYRLVAMTQTALMAMLQVCSSVAGSLEFIQDWIDSNPAAFNGERPMAKKEAPVVKMNVAGVAKEIMTMKEVAEYLGLNYSTVKEMVADNRIPHYILNKRARFRKEHVDRWFDAKLVKKARA